MLCRSDARQKPHRHELASSPSGPSAIDAPVARKKTRRIRGPRNRNFITMLQAACIACSRRSSIFCIYNNEECPTSNSYPVIDTLPIDGEISDVSTAREFSACSCLRGCEGAYGCGICVVDRNRRSGGQISARGALYARPRSEVARETRSSRQPTVGNRGLQRRSELALRRRCNR
jgi:hypothetical protein